MRTFRVGETGARGSLKGSARRVWAIPFLALLVLLPAAWKATADILSPATMYNRGNELYEEGKYQDAIEVYTEVAASGVSNGFLYYNLANSYFKEGDVAKAILWYSRARQILPRDRDVAVNLEFARRVRPDKIEEIPVPSVFKALRAVIFGLNLSELTFVGCVFYILTCASLILRILSRREPMRRLAGTSSLFLGAVLLLCLFWLGGRAYHADRTISCVVVALQTDAMSGPGDEYTKVMSLHEGAEALVEEEREGWYFVKLPNGLGGWIPANAAETI